MKSFQLVSIFEDKIKSFHIWHFLIYNQLAIKGRVQEPQNL